MKWIAYILAFLTAAYLLVAGFYTLIVWLLGGPFLTAFAVGIQWPRIFWRK